MAKAEPDMHEGALRGENARLQEALRFAEQERDAARATNQRLNRRCGDYERALAEKRVLCSDGTPRGSRLSRALLNAYVTEALAGNEVLGAENDALRELAWLLLTKRPENMVRLAPASWANGWPSHVWAGTTAENNEMLRERVPHLLRVLARVRFLSCEPLLEELDLGHSLVLNPCANKEQRSINWVIVGGESGSRARPFDLAWARSIVAQCADAGVPCFVKQLGSRPVGAPPTRHPAGADPSEWPEDLRVQEWPAEAS